jgi:tetratricopeptide (TPR) repeat protein
MSRIRIVTGVAAAWLLAGCATTPAPQQKAKGSDSEAQAQHSAAVTESLPNAELTPQRLYQILLGEIAVQRGQYPVAGEAYLRAASATRDPRLARRAAQISIYSRDRNRALEATRLWVELAPDDSEAVRTFAILLIQDERMGEAEPYLKRLLQQEGEAVGADEIAEILGQAPDKQQALQMFERLTMGMSSPEVVYASAHLAFLAGKPALALERVNSVLAAEPDNSEALMLKANALQHLGRKKEALEAFQAAVEAAPENVELRLSVARLLVDAGELEAAREQFEQLQRRMPDNPDVTYALGLLALEAGDLDAAEQSLSRLASGGEHADAAAYALGRIAEKRDEPQEAIRWYRTVGQGENYLDAQISIASILANSEGVSAAEKYLEKVQAKDRDGRIRIYLARGEILREHGQYKDSKAVYDRALKAYPHSAELRYARAMVAEKLDRLDLLESDLKAVLKSDPQNAQALNALGYTLADRTKRYQEAHRYISRALELSPDDPAILDSMGWVLYRMGRNDEALKYLRRAAGEFNDGEVSAHLGEVLWQSGKRDEAKQVWEKAVQRNPDSAILKRTQQRFLGR